MSRRVVTLMLLCIGLIVGGNITLVAAAELEATTQAIQMTRNYWTPERMANAKPLPLPEAGPLTLTPMSAPPVPVQASPGSPPPGNPVPNLSQTGLLLPQAPSLLPNMYSTDVGWRFTSSRLLSDSAAQLGAFSRFPYSLNGKLFFTIPAGTTQPPGNYICSGTVSRKRLVTTAGHCVSDGSGHFYSNWTFVPALRNTTRPFGTWNWQYIVVTNVWHTGGGGVPNAQDVAIIELQDIGGVPIWGYTGFAGYTIPDLYTGQHVTAIGYPGNFDSAAKAHRVDAEVKGGSTNTAQIGSDMRGGSSGGGWFINFGEYSVGQPTGSATKADTNSNALVAVTSYGPLATNPYRQGASILDNRYINILLNFACVHRVGNC